MCLWCGHEAALWIWSFWIGGAGSLDQGIGTERARWLEGKPQVEWELQSLPWHPTIPRPQVWEAETHPSGTPSTSLGSRDYCPHLTDEDTDSDLLKVTAIEWLSQD